MSQTRLDRIEKLFHRALELPETERKSFLDTECAADPELRAEVQALLDSDSVQDDGLARVDSVGERAGDQIGPYHLLERIDEGGMGSVWLAEQREPVKRQVALKLIKRGMGTKTVLTRFESERQALALMAHPNIAKVLDAGASETGRPYFVMEYVPGELITAYCDNQQLSLEQRIGLFQQVCHGVQHAHQKGIIHRDLKPQNIIVQVHDGVPVPRIIDFGVAKATSAKLTDVTLHTEFGQLIGTPEYMSPEQAEMTGDGIDTRSDIYSLGVLLYELLTGALPFAPGELRKAGLLEIQRKIREEEPAKPSTRLSNQDSETKDSARLRRLDSTSLGRRLRGDLDWVTMKALEKEPVRRYQSASELASDLSRHLQHEPVEAGPPSATYRLRKALRKYRVPVAAGILVFLALTVGLAAALWQAGIANEAKRRLEDRSLAVVIRLEHAEKNQEQLFPAWPQKIGAMREWLRSDGEWLRAELPRVRRVLSELRDKVLPLNEEDERRDRKEHPRHQEYEALRDQKLPALERAMRIRLGKEKPASPAVPADAPKDANGLNVKAWSLVNPNRLAEDYGQEALALALVERARELDSDHPWILNTLAWTLLANGRDEEARQAIDDALAAAPAAQKLELEERRLMLGNAIDEAERDLAKAREQFSRLETEVNKRRTFAFTDEEDKFVHRQLHRIEPELVAFLGEEGSVTDVERRLAWAEHIEELTLRHPEARVSWEDARAAIKSADDIVASKLYRAAPIELSPQTGLVPIGMNPKTKLWEFYHLRSAWDPTKAVDPAKLPIPKHLDDGRIHMTGREGIVFVLIPGGTFVMGTQATDPKGKIQNPATEYNEEQHEVRLPAFFLARHELTQGQWIRLSGGGNPSAYGPSWGGRPGPAHRDHPVERVDWNMCTKLMEHYGLRLPSTEEWEYGCRAGTTTVWFTGNEHAALERFANVRDQKARARYPAEPFIPVPFDDGHVRHAPVGSFAANPFGLHDVHGNVWEWCRNAASWDASRRCIRGGSFYFGAKVARSAAHTDAYATTGTDEFGLRPARALNR